jgi:hypothetical protein
MPTELLPVGPPTTLVQNQVYALPARLVHVSSVSAVEISVNGVAWNALTNANTVGAPTSAAFLRCPGGATIVTCKA